MIRHLGSALTDVTYVFDRRTIGLHPHDITDEHPAAAAAQTRATPCSSWSTSRKTIAIADHAVDLGPGAGTGGGTVCYEGPVEGLRGSDTVTGRHLEDRAALKEVVRTATGALEVRGADTHNLCDVDGPPARRAVRAHRRGRQRQNRLIQGRSPGATAWS
ncbi:MAG: hypothetical protein R2734_01250 [Nocardioides sp.]